MNASIKYETHLKNEMKTHSFINPLMANNNDMVFKIKELDNKEQ